MALLNCITYDREPAGWGFEAWGICVKYPNVKLFNSVTWDEWHALVRPNDENGDQQGNTQDDGDEEEQRSEQDDTDSEEIWSEKDDDEGI